MMHDRLNILYRGFWQKLGKRIQRGENIYDAEWDLLIILDACRVDLLEDFAVEFEWLKTIDRRTSVGSSSKEWMENTFLDLDRATRDETAYVTANTFSEDVFTDDLVGYLDEVWKYGAHEEYNVVPPKVVTERTIEIGREHDFNRVIAHYMQPHEPFLNYEVHPELGSDPFDKSVNSAKDFLRYGRVTQDEVWDGYVHNLQYVLNSVEDLLNNFDAEQVVITADHGEALGEWGIYGHPPGCLHPSVTTVPWVETAATDTCEIDPEVSPTEASDVTREEQMKHLGYL